MPHQKRIAIYPGSFDPVTNGHLEIIERSLRLFDHVVVAVSHNSQKNPVFTVAERIDLLKLALKTKLRQKKVSVDTFKGLLVKYARRKKAVAVVRGLRAISDFEYEFQMALMNRHQASDVETVFLMPDEKYTYLSSTLLKEILKLGGKVEGFLPKILIPKVRQKLAGAKS